MTPARSIRIAITALGGQGGGVLAGWIGKLGEENGFIAQTTSVPGVAQRTGATVYYIELFPKKAAEARAEEPVLALMPVPGDVDIVIAAEMMEAGRAITRGFVTGQTVLIASTHRDYAISEKSGMGDGRRDAAQILEAAHAAAKTVIAGDMAAAATEAGTMISAVLFGALAGSGALPIDRACFEDRIKAGGRAVEQNLRGFAFGVAFAAGSANDDGPGAAEADGMVAMHDEAGAPALAALQVFPEAVRFYVGEGIKRVSDFQDTAYAGLYLERVAKVLAADREAGGAARGWRLTQAAAKHLALWMSYEDSIRVADLKTRGARFDRFKQDVRAEAGQIVDVYEFLHPRVEEVCDILPAFLAKTILNSPILRRGLQAVLGGGKRIPTTRLRGFIPLYLLASARFLRRSSFRFALENARIEEWFEKILAIAPRDYDLSIEITKLQELIKGYGETHERGFGNYRSIFSAIDAVAEKPASSSCLRSLREAALQDEHGNALRAALAAMAANDKAAA